MKLVIVCGGKGTRLNLKGIPKSMVKIGGKPVLEHQIDLAKRYGIKDIFLLSGYLADAIFNYFKDGKKFKVNITHIIEPYPLGTAGCLKLIENLIGKEERFLVFSGDVLMDIDLDNLIKEDRQSNSTLTIMVHPNNHPYDSDLVETDLNNRVVAFYLRPHKEGIYYTNLAIASVYVLSGEIFKYIPFGQPSDFEKDILPKLLNKGKLIKGYRSPEYVKDMGTPDRLELVIKDYKSGKIARLNKRNKRKAIFLDRDGVINRFVDNLCRIKDFELMKDATDAIKKINQSEYLAIVITNQPMIAKGFLKENDLYAIHKKMATLLGKHQAYLDKVYYCPHHPERGFKGEVKKLKINCKCRKPKIGMFLKAKKDFNIDLKNSWMIGDDTVDLLAGENAGCKTIYLNANLESNQYADYVFGQLSTAVDFILKRGHDK